MEPLLLSLNLAKNKSSIFLGIEGAFSEPGQKTVIPRKVIGKFSIRLVPNQQPEQVGKYVVDYVNEQWKKYGSPNDMKVTFTYCQTVFYGGFLGVLGSFWFTLDGGSIPPPLYRRYNSTSEFFQFFINSTL